MHIPFNAPVEEVYRQIQRHLESEHWIECPDLTSQKAEMLVNGSMDHYIDMSINRPGEVNRTDAGQPHAFSYIITLMVLKARKARVDFEFYIEEDAHYYVRRCGTEVERLKSSLRIAVPQ